MKKQKNRIYDQKCPACSGTLVFEDHSLVGGPREYWVCSSCGEEQVMFGGKV